MTDNHLNHIRFILNIITPSLILIIRPRKICDFGYVSGCLSGEKEII